MEKIRLIDDASVQRIVHLVVHARKCNSHRTQIGDRNTYELCAKNSLTHSIRVLWLLKLVKSGVYLCCQRLYTVLAGHGTEMGMCVECGGGVLFLGGGGVEEWGWVQVNTCFWRRSVRIVLEWRKRALNGAKYSCRKYASMTPVSQ